MKVLIAEDDIFFRKLLQQSLSSEFEVSVVEDGSKAWAILQQNDSPPLAILDWVMPKMTGLQICQEARANPRTASTYLILLTARNSAGDITAGLRAGADDYITKPVAPEELRARVRFGQRIVELQAGLQARSTALEDAITREQLLQTHISLLGSRLPAGPASRLTIPLAELSK
jgi:DNA-binding response OmpR family regulator